jgi:hypothetical protein
MSCEVKDQLGLLLLSVIDYNGLLCVFYPVATWCISLVNVIRSKASCNAALSLSDS